MKKSTIAIADTSPVISLALIDKLWLLDKFFDTIHIPRSVWNELNDEKDFPDKQKINTFFADRIKDISSFNELELFMDLGESEAVILYRELKADFLLIDDKKAREIAEGLGVDCIGTLAILIRAKELDFITELKPFFLHFMDQSRYYSKRVLNQILSETGESSLP